MINPYNADFLSAVAATSMEDTMFWTDAKPRGKKSGKKYFAYNYGLGSFVRDNANKRIRYGPKKQGCLAIKVSPDAVLEYTRVRCTRDFPVICKLPDTYDPVVNFWFVTQENNGLYGE